MSINLYSEAGYLYYTKTDLPDGLITLVQNQTPMTFSMASGSFAQGLNVRTFGNLGAVHMYFNEDQGAFRNYGAIHNMYGTLAVNGAGVGGIWNYGTIGETGTGSKLEIDINLTTGRTNYQTNTKSSFYNLGSIYASDTGAGAVLNIDLATNPSAFYNQDGGTIDLSGPHTVMDVWGAKTASGAYNGLFVNNGLVKIANGAIAFLITQTQGTGTIAVSNTARVHVDAPLSGETIRLDHAMIEFGNADAAMKFAGQATFMPGSDSWINFDGVYATSFDFKSMGRGAGELKVYGQTHNVVADFHVIGANLKADNFHLMTVWGQDWSQITYHG